MEPILNEQQTQIRDSAKRLCRDFAGPARLRALGDAPDATAWAEIVRAGWPGLLVPDGQDGLGVGLFELALIMEECGQRLLQAPFLGTCVGNAALARAQARPELDGGIVTPLLIDEGDVYGAGAKWPIATQIQGGWRLDGQLRVADGAGDAALLLLPARSGDAEALLLAVPRDAAGLTAQTQTNVDGSRADALTLSAVRLPDAAVLARQQAALDLNADIATLLRVGSSAELIGVASAALTLALEHLRTRKQFGKPLASFQALQHQCVNIFLDIELNRSLLYRTASAWDAGQAHPAMVAALKARASRSALAATRSALQLHGAMGYTRDHDIGQYYKRAVVLAARHGNENHHAAQFSALTLDEAPAS